MAIPPCRLLATLLLLLGGTPPGARAACLSWYTDATCQTHLDAISNPHDCTLRTDGGCYDEPELGHTSIRFDCGVLDGYNGGIATLFDSPKCKPDEKTSSSRSTRVVHVPNGKCTHMPAVTVPGTNQSLFVTYDCEDSSSTLIKVITVLMFSAFIVLILLDVAGVFRLGVPAAAVIAAMPILLVRAIGNDEQLDLAKLVDWTVIVIILALMIMSYYIKVFVVETANTGNSKTWLTPYYDRPFVLLGILTATSGVVSMIFTNDVGSFFLTQLLMDTCVAHNLDLSGTIPYLIAILTAANLGSSATTLGSPHNIYMAEANGIGFGPWLQYNIAPSILSLILDYLCLLVFYKVIGLVRGHSLVETIRLQPYFVDSIQDQQAMAYAASVDVLSTDSMTPHDHAVTSLMSIRSTASTRSRRNVKDAVAHAGDWHGLLINKIVIFIVIAGIIVGVVVEGERLGMALMSGMAAFVMILYATVVRTVWDYMESRGKVRGRKHGTVDISGDSSHEATEMLVGGADKGMIDAAEAAAEAADEEHVQTTSNELSEFDKVFASEEVDMGTLIFFIGLFILTGGLMKTPYPHKLWSSLVSSKRHLNTYSGWMIMSLIMWLLSNVFQNTPACILAQPEIAQYDDCPALAYGVAWAASCGANVCFIGGAAQVIVYSVLVRYQRKMALEDTQHHAKNLGSKYFAYQVLFGVWSSLVILLVTSSLLFFISGAADCALPLQP